MGTGQGCGVPFLHSMNRQANIVGYQKNETDLKDDWICSYGNDSVVRRSINRSVGPNRGRRLGVPSGSDPAHFPFHMAI